jgi:hypothetical protein
VTPVRDFVLQPFKDGTLITSAPPVVRWYPADVPPPEPVPHRATDEIRRKVELRALAASAGAVPTPRFVEARGRDGSTTFYPVRRLTGDADVDELVAIAAIPLDEEVVVDAPTSDPALDMEVAKLAAQDRRDRVVEQRRKDADERFSGIEARAIAASAARARYGALRRSLVASGGRLRCRTSLARRIW